MLMMRGATTSQEKDQKDDDDQRGTTKQAKRSPVLHVVFVRPTQLLVVQKDRQRIFLSETEE